MLNSIADSHHMHHLIQLCDPLFLFLFQIVLVLLRVLNGDDLLSRQSGILRWWLHH